MAGFLLILWIAVTGISLGVYQLHLHEEKQKQKEKRRDSSGSNLFERVLLTFGGTIIFPLTTIFLLSALIYYIIIPKIKEKVNASSS